MTRHTQTILSIFFVLTVSSELSAKPLRIVVEDRIGSSNFAGQVVISGYDGKGKIFFKSTEYKDTITEAEIGEQLVKGYDFPYKPTENKWTENYPHIGDTVFIVVNDLVRIFGKRIKNDYRLWSPLETGSISIFEFSAPLKPINSSMVLKTFGNTISCWDGCLLPISLTKNIISEYRQRFKGKLNTIQLKALFGQKVETVFYNDTLKFYNNLVWVDEPPGKLRSLIVTYITGQSIEIVPESNNSEPVVFDISRQFKLNDFKKLKIKAIRWIK